MATIRRFNWLSQARVDLPHLKLLESAVAGDFDLGFGKIIAGNTPLIISGFYLVTTNIVGSPASSIQLNVQNGKILHPTASSSGTLFSVPSGRTVETLNNTNSRVSGAFLSSQVNYVGVDVVLAPDSSTSDQVQFIDIVTKNESPEKVPLAQTLDYKIIISNQAFSVTSNVCPIAIITTDSSNNVSAYKDARNGLFRLGLGGSVPNIYNAFSWTQGRQENTSGDVFSGGDKAITSLKSWNDAVMTRLWEIGGGAFWYSPTADRNVRMTRAGTTFTNGEWFEWVSSNLHWRGLKFVFDNSPAYYNDVKDQLIDSSGLTNLADGECIYVDLDRTTNRTGGTSLQPVKVAFASLGSPTVPGSRYIIAWRIGSNIYTRDSSFPVGATFTVASNTNLGIVQLTYAAGVPATPKVAPQDANGGIANTGTANNSFGFKGTAHANGNGVEGVGAVGVQGTGTSAGTGVKGIGGPSNGGTGGFFTHDAGVTNSKGILVDYVGSGTDSKGIWLLTGNNTTVGRALDIDLTTNGQGTAGGANTETVYISRKSSHQDATSGQIVVDNRFTVDHLGFYHNSRNYTFTENWSQNFTVSAAGTTDPITNNTRWKSIITTSGSITAGGWNDNLGNCVILTPGDTNTHACQLIARGAGISFNSSFNNRSWEMVWDAAVDSGAGDTMLMGIVRSNGSTANALYFSYTPGVNSGNWQLIANGVATNTSVAPSATGQRFRIEVHGSGTAWGNGSLRAVAYIDGAAVANITANIETTNVLYPFFQNTRIGSGTLCTLYVNSVNFTNTIWNNSIVNQL